MGSTHAVDILVEINWELAARSLVAGRRWHLQALLRAGPIGITNPDVEHPAGLVWELFAGSARWTQACAEAGFLVLTPVELLNDPNLNLLDVLFQERVVLIARSKTV